MDTPFEAVRKKEWNWKPPHLEQQQVNHSMRTNNLPIQDHTDHRLAPLNKTYTCQTQILLFQTIFCNTQPVKEYGYDMDLTKEDYIDLITSSNDVTICLDELPEQLWDRHVFVHSIYNISAKALITQTQCMNNCILLSFSCRQSI